MFASDGKPAATDAGQTLRFGTRRRGRRYGFLRVLVLASAGKLVLIFESRRWVRAAAGSGQGFGLIIERGNVKWLSGSEAEALFEIPAGFTQEAGS